MRSADGGGDGDVERGARGRGRGGRPARPTRSGRPRRAAVGAERGPRSGGEARGRRDAEVRDRPGRESAPAGASGGVGRGRPVGPPVDADVTGAELDPEVRADLSSLGRDLGREVARHLVMAGRLIDEDPGRAWEHAQSAKRLAARIGSVREAAGLSAYRAGLFAEALAELRTARRLTGSVAHLPLMADCERGLGRPERALALAASAEASALERAEQVELLIVAAGARADLGQLEAAVLTLQVPLLKAEVPEQWSARLRSAYADALDAVGRHAEGRRWLELAAEADVTGETGAAERLAELDGVVLVDLEEASGEQPVVADGGPAAGASGADGRAPAGAGS